MWLPLVLLLSSCPSPGSAARILALTTTPSRSHHIWNQALVRALVARGHHVTSISPDIEPNSHENHTHILIEGAYEYISSRFNYEERRKQIPLLALYTQFRWGLETCAQGLASPGAQSLMTSNLTFDLVIVEVVYTECFLGLLTRFGNPPVLGVTAFGTPPWANTMTGTPLRPSHEPHFTLQYSHHMGFWQRLVNLLMHACSKLYRSFVYLPKMDEIARRHFGPELPPVRELEKNISLVLVNSHFSWDQPRPTYPSLIPVAGLHLRPPPPLPADLQTYLDNAEHGAIYFSLGSNLKSNQLDQKKIRAILDAFRVLPQKFLVKWESGILEDQPPNVKIGKWFPQDAILGHPNVRLFVTHSGLLSIQEAVFNGVPVVGIPFFADQFHNIHKAVNLGIGLQLDFGALTNNSVFDAIRTVLGDTSYWENMQKLSRIFRDRPQHPLERAVFLTEFLLRHPRARDHLASAVPAGDWENLLFITALFCAASVLILLVLNGSLTVVTLMLMVKFREKRE